MRYGIPWHMRCGFAGEHKLKTIAFPAIGTGIGGFSLPDCAEIMLKETANFLREQKSSIETVYFVLFDEDAREIFENSWNTLQARDS